jgi:diguanylate cyclase (GGDEF)-like protein
MFIDLDNFKNVNDSLGHQAGDELLVEVAHRLQYCLRKTDTIARLGGDEFTVILTNIAQQSDVDPVIDQLLQSLARPFILGQDNEIHITASIGVTFCPDDATDEQTLMRHADTAMYRAKGSGKNRSAHFSPSLDHDFNPQISLPFPPKSPS